MEPNMKRRDSTLYISYDFPPTGRRPPRRCSLVARSARGLGLILALVSRTEALGIDAACSPIFSVGVGHRPVSATRGTSTFRADCRVLSLYHGAHRSSPSLYERGLAVQAFSSYSSIAVRAPMGVGGIVALSHCVFASLRLSLTC